MYNVNGEVTGTLKTLQRNLDIRRGQKLFTFTNCHLFTMTFSIALSRGCKACHGLNNVYLKYKYK